MRQPIATTFILLCIGFGCPGQNPPVAATADELQYLRFVLMSAGSIDHHPDAIKHFEDGLVKHHALNAQEYAQIHAAALELNALLKQLRPQVHAVTTGKTKLSLSDSAALANLVSQRDHLIETLANRILSSVRPETAARLRTPGRLMAERAGLRGK